MRSRDDASLLDILQAARRIVAFCLGMDAASFSQDLRTQSAVLHQLLIIGEATKRLSPAIRQANAHIPWRLMAGMRDQLIHAYDDVDLDEVWRTVTNDLPSVLPSLEQMVSERIDEN